MAIIKIESDDHWHSLRRRHVGASDVAALFNCGNSYTPTVNELYHEKRGNLPPEKGLNILAELGKAMEPFIAFVVSDIQGWRLEPCKLYHEHPEHKHIGCTLDYFVVESEHGPGVMQIKNVQQFTPGWTQYRAPDHVELQVQHEYLVCNAAREAEGLKPFKWGCIAAMFAGNPEDIRVMLRKPDPKIHQHIIQRVNKFMGDVVSGHEPPIMSSEDYPHINDLFKFAEDEPEADPLDLRGDTMIDDHIGQWVEATAKRKDADMKVQEMKARILHKLMREVKGGGQVYRRQMARTSSYIVNVQKNGALKIRPANE